MTKGPFPYRPRAGQAGFTLLEVLISVLLLGLLLTGLALLMRGQLRALADQIELAHRQAEINRAIDLLDKDIQSGMVAIEWSPKEGCDRYLIFGVGPKDVTVTLPFPLSLFQDKISSPQISVVEYRFNPAAGTLLRGETLLPFLPTQSGGTYASPTSFRMVMSGLRSFVMSYRNDNGDDEGGWLSLPTSLDNNTRTQFIRVQFCLSGPRAGDLPGEVTSATRGMVSNVTTGTVQNLVQAIFTWLAQFF